MLYYYHKYKVSSGKEHRIITKIYESEKDAVENHILLGGTVKVLKEVETEVK